MDQQERSDARLTKVDLHFMQLAFGRYVICNILQYHAARQMIDQDAKSVFN